MAASSSSAQDPPNPSALQPPPSSSTASRRLPPPCWSHDETVALIDAYREKWYSLRRGNLRASHWQEVADGVAERCPLSSGSPQKTSVQCRHKMEKLRKRYRAEIQRAAATSTGRNRYSSAWVHFKRMDSMEKGPTAVAVPVNTVPIDDEDDEEEEDDDEEYQENFYPKNVKNSASYSQIHYGSAGNGNGGNGFRIRIPSRSNMVPPPSISKFDEFSTPSPNPNPNFGNSKNFKDGYSGNDTILIKLSSNDNIPIQVSVVQQIILNNWVEDYSKEYNSNMWDLITYKGRLNLFMQLTWDMQVNSFIATGRGPHAF